MYKTPPAKYIIEVFMDEAVLMQIVSLLVSPSVRPSVRLTVPKSLCLNDRRLLLLLLLLHGIAAFGRVLVVPV